MDGMDGWVDGMDGWMDGWMDGMDGWMDVLKNHCAAAARARRGLFL